MTEPAQREPEVNKLFRFAVKHGATELHLEAGGTPVMRVGGTVREMTSVPLSGADLRALLSPVLDAERQHALAEDGVVDFTHTLPAGGHQFRVSLVRREDRLHLSAHRSGTA